MDVPLAETYESMQRGVIDGCTGFTSNFVSWKLMEPAKYFVDVAPGLGPMMLIVNMNSFGKKVQKEFQEPVLKTLKLILLAHRGVMQQDTAYEHDVIMPKYMKFYKPTHEEEMLWMRAGKPLVQEWLSKTGSLGRKAMDIVEKYNGR
jgi:TRAP-type C4-dicarboxylate transport system substrate-binding protein